jgi:hypothetical protein
MSFRSWINEKIVDLGTQKDADGPLYKPLSTAENQIRLLVIRGGEKDDELSFFMNRYPIGGITYMALSYVWGDSADTENIKINRKTVAIRKNLANALRYLRPWMKTLITDSPPVLNLWVDSLCINQSDPEEKNHQVKLMKKIYSNATVVYSWLGIDANTAEAFKDVQRIRIQIEEHEAWKRDHLSWIKNCPDLSKSDESTVSSENPTGNATWNRLKLLASNEYWTRTWIVQEIVLGETIFFSCRGEILKDIDIRALYLWHKSLMENKPTAPPDVDERICQCLTDEEFWVPFRNLLAICERRALHEFHSSEAAIPMKEIGNFSTTLKATNPKDKIYGLLSLAEAPGDLPVEVNYNNSIGEVYRDYFRHILEKNRSLYPLKDAGVGLYGSGYNGYSLPSWCPDWNNLSLRQLAKTPPERHTHLEDPSTLLHNVKHMDVHASIHGNILRSKGFTLQVVEETVSVKDRAEFAANLIILCSSEQSDERNYAPKVDVSELFKMIRITSLYDRQTPVDLLIVAFIAWLARILMLNLPLVTDETIAINTLLRLLHVDSGVGFYESVRHRLLGHYEELPDIWTNQTALEILYSEKYASLFTDPYRGDLLLPDAKRVGNPFRCEKAMNALIAAVDRIVSSKLFFFRHNHLGLGPLGLRKDDQIVMLLGFPYPLNIRRTGQQYVVVGICYMLALSAMEAFKEYDEGLHAMEEFDMR